MEHPMSGVVGRSIKRGRACTTPGSAARRRVPDSWSCAPHDERFSHCSGLALRKYLIVGRAVQRAHCGRCMHPVRGFNRGGTGGGGCVGLAYHRDLVLPEVVVEVAVEFLVQDQGLPWRRREFGRRPDNDRACDRVTAPTPTRAPRNSRAPLDRVRLSSGIRRCLRVWPCQQWVQALRVARARLVQNMELDVPHELLHW